MAGGWTCHEYFRLGMCLDYVSLLKTRLLLKKASAGRFIGGFLILDIDRISILIPTSISVYGSMRNALIYSHYDLWHAALGVPGELYEVFWEGVSPRFTHRSTGFPLLGVLISSTLMTSIWIAATWLAIILLLRRYSAPSTIHQLVFPGERAPNSGFGLSSRSCRIS